MQYQALHFAGGRVVEHDAVRLLARLGLRRSVSHVTCKCKCQGRESGTCLKANDGAVEVWQGTKNAGEGRESILRRVSLSCAVQVCEMADDRPGFVRRRKRRLGAAKWRHGRPMDCSICESTAQEQRHSAGTLHLQIHWCNSRLPIAVHVRSITASKLPLASLADDKNASGRRRSSRLFRV